MKDIKDNFSNQATEYAGYRPGYPQELFDFIYQHCKQFNTAWDCATGNGQAAIHLSERFNKVYATDISDQQLEQAQKRGNIIYSNARAEATGFEDNTFDLITVAQALHWFDHDAFFKEVERVSKPGAVFAAWGYNLIRGNEELNNIIDDFYHNIVGPYWDAERRHVDNEYKSINIPFEELPCPTLSISYHWTYEQLIGYLNSWSSVQHYIKKHDTNPISLIANNLRSVYNNHQSLTVTFPLFIRPGIIS